MLTLHPFLFYIFCWIFGLTLRFVSFMGLWITLIFRSLPQVSGLYLHLCPFHGSLQYAYALRPFHGPLDYTCILRPFLGSLDCTSILCPLPGLWIALAFLSVLGLWSTLVFGH